ncbi:uncharacterized protein LOC130967713 [Arachis stenosperma]|uniref:uncharacterized protein LOC130967713 n=1 Tax=Arachis stenosperma TaxID=217475 RepID=UPI0025AC526B|nr:uncharacterized protein LOC130967713 [Arachis stenosperma]
MHTSVEGIKRQLPSWMVKKVGTNHVSNSDNVGETTCSVDKGDVATENGGNRKTQKEKENAEIDHNRGASKRKSNLNAKGEAKRKRKSSQGDGSSGSTIQKKNNKGNGPMDQARKSSRKKCRNLEDHRRDSTDVIPGQASDDENDLELTVDDLMTIAEQYVKEHEYKKRQEKSNRQGESKSQIPTKSEPGSALDSCCKNTKTPSSSRETLCGSTRPGKLITTSTFQQVNPAKEFLEMYFGFKPLEKEEEKQSVVHNLEFTYECTRQSQDDHVGEEVVPLTKKRSTLKDKVAMFLD